MNSFLHLFQLQSHEYVFLDLEKLTILVFQEHNARPNWFTSHINIAKLIGIRVADEIVVSGLGMSAESLGNWVRHQKWARLGIACDDTSFMIVEVYALRC